MSKLIRDFPYTEIVETVQDLTRSASDDKKRIRGIVDRKYRLGIPREYDWSFLKSSSALSCVAQIISGVAIVTTQDTVVTLSGHTITDATNDGRKIKFGANPNVYDFTYTDTTGGTISPPLSGATNVSNGTYSIFKTTFPLASDFDRFPINGGLLYYSGGKPTPLPELDDDDYYNDYATASPCSVVDACRPVGYDSAGNLQYELVPPPSTAIVVPYEYVKALPPMVESTAGTVVVAGSNVTGTETAFTEATTGDYFRQDFMGTGIDSQWYKIAVITHDSSITLVKAVASDNAGAQDYTVSSTPKYPVRLQEALIYGSISDILPDQNDPNYLYYHSQYAQIMTDNKVIIATRNQKNNVELIAEDINYRR